MTPQETAFLGKITAGMTHEIKNVLAVINESSGLLEDLLTLTNQASFPHLEKFHSVLGTIQEQIRRGVEITSRLNRFAHSMDEPILSVNMNELLDQMAFLMQRFARLKQAKLKVLAEEETTPIRTDPFGLQLVLSACIECCLDDIGEGEVVTLRLRRADQGVAIRISRTQEGSNHIHGSDALPEALSGLQQVIQKLNANLVSFTDGEERGFLIALPAKKAPLLGKEMTA